MAARPVEKMTLRELFTASKNLTRELTEHLERNLANQVHELERLSRAPSERSKRKGTVADVSLRTAAEKAAESHAFAEQICDRLSEVLEAIQQRAPQALS